ncbi:R-linalool synthase QH5, chloroplastic-like [Bidens hawaiensis]|uniref:R-linalool synthase QH5, chloroplastic-like n=1 Tax=Bidens hawaiensis TaxID=980011 RepID=UPI00404B1962
MASMSSFSCSVLHCKIYHETFKQFETRKALYSSKSTSKSKVIVKAITTVEPVSRRSANYAPSLWSFDYVQSLSSEYTGEDCKARADTLKDAVKMMIHKVASPLSTLELVDDLQRLGISYHFEDEIRNLLEVIYNNHYKTHDQWNTMDLNLKALGFRLLRQHGFQVSQDIFHNFKEKTQDLKPHSQEDMIGMLNLYEASYHSFDDESILDDTRDFSAKYLEENKNKMDEIISSLVIHALELPLHWRVPRVESEWFIRVYEKRSDMNPALLELAKLDFNMVQAVYIEDLKEESRWWRNTKWVQKLSFIRDSVVPSFLWTIGFGYLPHYSLGRSSLTRCVAMVTVIDDIYDVYGTLDELQQFTDIVDRWDINSIEKLPDYMKTAFFGFYNTINEIAYNTLTETEILILPYFIKAWANLCKAYLVEARWYYSGYKPTLKEYLDNAYISVAGPLVLVHAKFATSVGATQEILQRMEEFDTLDRYSSLILRLADDLGTSTDELARGDVPKSIQCYMHESGATEEEARKYIKELIADAWKKLNKERMLANTQFSREHIEYASNMARMAQFMYGKGDGHGRPDITKAYLSSLLFSPI